MSIASGGVKSLKPSSRSPRDDVLVDVPGRRCDRRARTGRCSCGVPVLGVQHHVELAADGVLHLAQLAHRGADLAADLGQAVRSEDQQRHEQDDEDFRGSDAHAFRSEHRTRNRSAARLQPAALGVASRRSRRCVRVGLRAELDQRGPEIPAETVERRTGRRELTANPRDQHCEQRSSRARRSTNASIPVTSAHRYRGSRRRASG